MELVRAWLVPLIYGSSPFAFGTFLAQARAKCSEYINDTQGLPNLHQIHRRALNFHRRQLYFFPIVGPSSPLEGWVTLELLVSLEWDHGSGWDTPVLSTLCSPDKVGAPPTRFPAEWEGAACLWSSRVLTTQGKEASCLAGPVWLLRQIALLPGWPAHRKTSLKGIGRREGCHPQKSCQSSPTYYPTPCPWVAEVAHLVGEAVQRISRSFVTYCKLRRRSETLCSLCRWRRVDCAPSFRVCF